MKVKVIKKKINKNDLPSKLPKIKQALSILENIDIQRKLKNFFKKLKAKSISVHTKKITTLFFQRLAKYSRKMYLKVTFKMLISYFISYINYKDGLNKSKSNSILISPKTSTKKIKKFRVHNSRNIKVELMTKKTGNQKRGGVDKLIQKIEKEKEMERIKQQQTNIGNMNIINEKLKKLDSLKKKEKEYLIKMKEKKKKIQDEINLFRKKTNISEEGLSQIKQNNNFSEKDSSFLSEKIAKELGGTSDFKQGSNRNKGILSEVISSNEMDSIVSKETKIIKIKDGNKENNEDEIYSFKSKESKKSSTSKNELNGDWMRKSVKTINKKNLDTLESKKNMRVSVKLSDLNFKKKHNEHISIFTLKSPEIKTKKRNVICT